MGDRHLAHRLAVARDHVDHARRQAGRLERAHGDVGGELLGRRWLPDDDVAQQRRRGRQVAGDRGEVERRDREHEPFERAVVAAIPHPGRVRRLVGQDAVREADVEAQEVDQLAGGIDLGLVHRLRLPEHGGGVDLVAPGRRQQFGRPQEHSGPLVEGQLPPARRREQCGIDGGLHIGRGGIRPSFPGRTGAGAASPRRSNRRRHPAHPADHHRQLGATFAQAGQRRRDRCPLRAPGTVSADRLVQRDGRDGGGIHAAQR